MGQEFTKTPEKIVISLKLTTFLKKALQSRTKRVLQKSSLFCRNVKFDPFLLKIGKKLTKKKRKKEKLMASLGKNLQMYMT